MGQGGWHVLQANVPPSLVCAFEVSRPPLCLTRYLSYHTEQCQMVGASMNLQNACPQQSSNQNCQVTCQDPSQSNQCVTLQSQLIDGSPCGQSLFVSDVTCLMFDPGYGGFCSGGHCQAGSAFDTAKVSLTSQYLSSDF